MSSSRKPAAQPAVDAQTPGRTAAVAMVVASYVIQAAAVAVLFLVPGMGFVFAGMMVVAVFVAWATRMVYKGWPPAGRTPAYWAMLAAVAGMFVWRGLSLVLN